MAEYKYKFPNESFSGCDMTASIVYSWDEVNEAQGKSKSNSVIRKFATHILGEIQTISYSIHMEKRAVRSIGNVNAKDFVMGPRTIAGSLVFAVFNRHFAKNIMQEHNAYFKKGEAFLVDELPPFDIVISFANEYGLRSKLVIYGVRLLNEGQVMSVNDVFTENTYQFMATDVEYLNDEKTYQSRTKGQYFLKIRDNYSPKDPNLRPNYQIGKVLARYNDPTGKNIEHISLAVSTVNASRNHPNGRAVFSLYPLQSEGKITISNSSNKTRTIVVNGKSSYSLDLPPDLYTARFSKPNPDSWKCNSKSFDIKEFRDKYSTRKYAPIIEVITDTSIQIYSNEPSHTHARISEYKSNEAKFYELKSRRVNIKGLDRNKRYDICTCNGPNTITSPSVTVKTFNSFDKPFNDFKKMVECNQQLLLYKEMDRYFNMIDEAKKLASSTPNYQSPTDSIVMLKKRYEKELSKLDKKKPDYNDKYAELTHNIYVCNELIYLSGKVHNNIIASVNKEAPVDVPKMFYNENYDTIFQFSDETTRAEFYRVYKNLSQSAQTVNSTTFSTIDGKENCFNYVGKSGTNHFVQALREHVRSPKLEFYVMTVKEKLEKIKNDENKDIINEQTQKKINTVIKDELGSNINNSMLTRAFMRKVKTIDNALLLDVEIIEKTEDHIEVSTPVHELIDKDSDATFYLSVARKDDIVNNDFIYKKKFSNKDETIILENSDYALFKDIDYAIWIEDSNFNQISNVTTFNMTLNEDMNDRLVLEYELTKILDDIKGRLEPVIPGVVYSSLCSFLEHNEDITKTNVVDQTLLYLLYAGLGDSVLIKSIAAIKELIGVMMESDDIISDEMYNNDILSFNSNKDASLLTMSFNKNGVTYTTTKGGQTNNVDLTQSKDDYVIVLLITPDLKYKSKIIFINRKSNKMEVL